MMLGIVLAAAGVIVLIAGLAQLLQNRSYADSCEVQANITGKHSRRVKNGVAYELYTEYAVDGESYKKTVGVTAQEFDAVGAGDTVTLRYKPKNPKCAVPPSTLNPKNARVVLIVGGALTVLGAVIIVLNLI